MKRILSVVCCISMTAIPVLAQHHHGNAEANANTPMSDQQFVDFAAQTDMVEANMGQMAQQQSDQQSVKDYGQMLETDHTADYHQLQDVAKQANLNVPNAIDDEHNKAMIGPFSKLKGAAFDRRFVPGMVTGHTQALEIYKKEADNAQNQALKNYAQQAIPVLQKHLDDAKNLQKSKAATK